MVSHIQIINSEPEGYEAVAFNQMNAEIVRGFGALPSMAINDMLVNATHEGGGSSIDGEVDPRAQD